MSAAPLSAATDPPAYRSQAPQTLRLRVSDIADSIPADVFLRPIEEDETIDLPASHIFAHIVPTLSVNQLAEIRPDLIAPCSKVVRLPAQRIAKSYRLVETMNDAPEEPDNSLLRMDIPSPVSHLEKLLTPPEALPLHHEDSPAPIETHAQVECESPPRRLTEIISNLPTFQRVTETTFLTLTPLSPEPPPATNSDTNSGIPEQHALQALFMTDEILSTGRIVELCGGLPGIQSCILTSDTQVVASHNIPEGLDLVSLSSNAAGMLRAMQGASAGMGIGEIPAMTLHTAKGPLSIFQRDHLALLVFHGVRGFVPGVREKMTATLTELARAPLALPPKATNL